MEGVKAKHFEKQILKSPESSHTGQRRRQSVAAVQLSDAVELGFYAGKIAACKSAGHQLVRHCPDIAPFRCFQGLCSAGFTQRRQTGG